MFVALCQQVDDMGALTFRDSRNDQLFSGGWNAVLDTLPDAGAAALNMWLDDALLSSERRESLGRILASAVRGIDGRTGWRAAVLAKVLFAWQPVITDIDRQPHATVRDEIYSAVLEEVPALTASAAPLEAADGSEPVDMSAGFDPSTRNAV